MKQNCLVLLILFLASSAVAQASLSRSGTISFFSDAPLEKIEAHNRQVISKIDLEEGTLDFAILMKAFQFEKALMQTQFNNDYLESDKYPKSNFQGQIQNLPLIDLTKDGSYPVTVTGILFLHGVSKRITEKGTLKVSNGKVTHVSSKFAINLQDYHIKIPVILKEKISEIIQIEVSVDF